VTNLTNSTWIPLISILAAFVVLVAAAKMFIPPDSDLSPRLDYIGQTYQNGGWLGEYCQMRDSAPVVSLTKIAVQVRKTVCSHDPILGYSYLFVFVRPITSKNSVANLVLRLQLGDDDSELDPEFSWTRPAKLRVMVRNNDYWIERELNRISGVQIEYRFAYKNMDARRCFLCF